MRIYYKDYDEYIWQYFFKNRLFKDTDGNTYIEVAENGFHPVLAIGSVRFRRLMRNVCREQYGKAPRKPAQMWLCEKLHRIALGRPLIEEEKPKGWKWAVKRQQKLNQ